MTPEERKTLVETAKRWLIVNAQANQWHYEIMREWVALWPAVPIAELRQLANEMLDDAHRTVDNAVCAQWLNDTCDKYDPSIQPPNPHKPGTYCWAREEHKRGKRVLRKEMIAREKTFGARTDIRSVNDPNGVEWAQCWFSDEDVNATDWEVVGDA